MNSYLLSKILNIQHFFRLLTLTDMRAVTQLRNTQKVKRLVYISCSPASAVKNFVDLTRPSSKTLRGAPFLPVRAVPVDMFPQTKHVELAILFEREEEVVRSLKVVLLM